MVEQWRGQQAIGSVKNDQGHEGRDDQRSHFLVGWQWLMLAASRRIGGQWRWLGGGECMQLWAEHAAQGATVDELYVVLAGGGLVGGLGEFAAGDDDGAGGVFVDFDAEQFVDGVVGDLFGVPVFGLDEYVVVAFTKFQVDAAIEAGASCAGADMFNVPALSAVVVGQHRFQLIPAHTGQGVIAAIAYVLQSSHSAPPTEVACSHWAGCINPEPRQSDEALG